MHKKSYLLSSCCHTLNSSVAETPDIILNFNIGSSLSVVVVNVLSDGF